MIDHVSVRVSDFQNALAFYRAALAPLGYEVLMEYPGAAGLGEKGKPDFWLMQTPGPINPTHVAFHASRDVVDAFHAAALARGGVDNGPPGLRADYHPHYYAAFVRDPEGNNVEVVCHLPPGVSLVPKAKAGAKKPAKKSVKKVAAKKPAVKAAAKGKPAKAKKKIAAKPSARRR